MKVVRRVTAEGKHDRKRFWALGWNGERLARNSDTKLTAERHPAIYQWVIETLKGANDDQRGAAG
jgi:hypothetical protein